MVNLKFDYEIELKTSILTIDHEENSCESLAMVNFFDHWPWGKFQGVMVSALPPSPPPPKYQADYCALNATNWVGGVVVSSLASHAGGRVFDSRIHQP